MDAAVLLDGAWRLAAAIVLESLAFVICNVGSRSPGAVVRAFRGSLRRPQAFFAGAVALVTGLILLAAAGLLVAPTLPDAAHELAPALVLTTFVALGIELLVGDGVRALASR